MGEIADINDLVDSDITASVGITGGYGIITAIDVYHTFDITTPFGEPSDAIIVGELNGTDVAFVPRHGQGHTIPSHEVNYRANMYALYALGVSHVISAIAAGSLNEEIPPGSVVFPTDYIDETVERHDTFFDEEPVHHFSSADPFCANLIDLAMTQADEAGLSSYTDATAVVIEGPRFATQAESHKYRSFGADIINMSVYPEVALARELEFCFLNLALITDYDIGDVGDVNHEPVTLEMIDEIQEQYNPKSTRLIKRIVSRLPLHSVDCCSGYRESARKSGHPDWEYAVKDRDSGT